MYVEQVYKQGNNQNIYWYLKGDNNEVLKF